MLAVALGAARYRASDLVLWHEAAVRCGAAIQPLLKDHRTVYEQSGHSCSEAVLAVVVKLRCNKQSGRLFDHLVGDRQELRRDRETNRFGGRKIEDKIEFGRLLDR